MKYFKATTIIFFTFLLFSCSSDESTPVEMNTLPGTWKIISADLYGETTYNSFPVIVEGNGINYNGNIVFTENPNEYNSDVSFDATIAIKISNVPVSEENYENFNDTTQSGTWSLDNTQLTLTPNDTNQPESVSLIFSNNGNTITTEGIRTVTQQGITIDLNYTLVYERQ